MKPKTAKRLWIIVSLVGILAMLMFTLMPAFK